METHSGVARATSVRAGEMIEGLAVLCPAACADRSQKSAGKLRRNLDDGSCCCAHFAAHCAVSAACLV